MEGTGKSEIEAHPLLYKTIEELSPVFKPRLKSISPEEIALMLSKKRHRRAPKLSAAQSYNHLVFWYAKNIVQALKRLDDATIYVRDFPKPRGYLNQGITEYDWIQYHYHAYVVGAVALYDIALQLTNAVFRLGVEERQVRKDSIEDNLWVKATNVPKLLRNLRSATSRLRPLRHLFIHAGDSLKLDDLSTLDVICEANKVFNKLGLTYEYSADEIKGLFKPDIDQQVHEMSEDISFLKDRAVELFDGLLPIYEFWSSFLRSVDKSNET